jgi:hypothetical protein
MVSNMQMSDASDHKRKKVPTSANEQSPPLSLPILVQVLLTTNEGGARFVKVRVRTICIPQVRTKGLEQQGVAECTTCKQPVKRPSLLVPTAHAVW